MTVIRDLGDNRYPQGTTDALRRSKGRIIKHAGLQLYQITPIKFLHSNIYHTTDDDAV